MPGFAPGQALQDHTCESSKYTWVGQNSGDYQIPGMVPAGPKVFSAGPQAHTCTVCPALWMDWLFWIGSMSWKWSEVSNGLLLWWPWLGPPKHGLASGEKNKPGGLMVKSIYVEFVWICSIVRSYLLFQTSFSCLGDSSPILGSPVLAGAPSFPSLQRQQSWWLW